MRNAPSVSYPVGRCAFWIGLLLGMAFLLVGTFLLAWSALPGVAGWGLGLALVLWGYAAAHSAWHQPTGWLHYGGASNASGGDEAGWTWLRSRTATPVPLGKLRVVADLQHRVLLETSGAGAAPRWIWLDASRIPADWLALRRALLASAAA
ncbi:MAG: hypothetical protein IBJ14_13935 [Hydrogenophaga sp.]|nr:hypothetical protein [Hydrogenophaga sp.]